MELLHYLLFLLENDISDYIERNYLLGMDLSMNPFIVNTPEFNQYGLYNILIGFYEDTDYNYLNGSEICYSVLIVLNTSISFLNKNTIYDEFRNDIKNNVKFSHCNFILNISQDENLLDISNHKLDLIKTDIFSSVFIPMLNDFDIYSAELYLNLKNNEVLNDIYLMKILKCSINSLKIDSKTLVPRLKNCVLYMDILNILYEIGCLYIALLVMENKIVCKNLYLNKYSNKNENVNLFLQSIIHNIGISFFVDNIYLNTVLPLSVSDIEQLCQYLKVIQLKSSCNLYINEMYADVGPNIFNYLQQNSISFIKLSREDIRGLYAKSI